MTGTNSPPSAGIGLSPEQFAATFPFHLAFGRDLRLLQVGRSLRRVASDLVPGASIAQSIDLIHPEEDQLNFEWIVANRERFFLIRHRLSGLHLRGEFVLLPDAQALVFLASPWLTDSSQLNSFGLELGDFAVHDSITDLLLVMQFNKQALEDVKALNDNLALRQAELRQTNAQLSLQFQVAHLMSQARTPIEATAGLLEPICATLDWQCGGLWIVRGGLLQFAAGWHPPEFDAEAFLKASRESDMEYGSGLPGRVWSSFETVWIEDLTREPNFRRAAAAARAGLRGAVVFPIRMQSRVWAVIELFSGKPLPLNQSLLSTFTSVSGQVSQAVERLESQVQLRLAKDEAIALSAAKGKYVSTVSHEIRTPLNAVIGMTSVIKGLPMDRKLQDGILTIENAAEQLLSIVNNVLDIERIDAGAIQLSIVNFDIHKLVAHVLQIIRVLPAAGSLDIDSSVDAEVPRFLLGDQGRISQVLINLMSNAVKFTERGSVRLRVRSQVEGADRVRVQFVVQDTGKGIPRSMHEKVFEAFEQVSTSISGAGLGLTICREFAMRMGGELTMESSEGAGSTFTFSAPLQRGLLQPENEPQRVSALHALKILDSAPELAFDELVAEAARACDVPIALVSLVDEHRQWFKAKVGLEASQTPRDQAFCAQAILTPERPLVVPDTLSDPRFSLNPLVTADPRIRFYAGVPLVDGAGRALGTLCVLDRVPRELSAAQLAELQRLAGKVMAQLMSPPLRVLVAEDTPSSQLVLRQMLEQQGHWVRVVGDGKQAVRAFAEESFDLVLLDIQMPVMDGLQAARAMRRHERCGRDFPIVGLSAYATQKDRENAIESGMTSYLVKPVRTSDIVTLIAQLNARPTTSMAPALRQGAAGGDTVDEAALRQLSDDLGPAGMATALAQFELDAHVGLERLRLSAAADDGEQLRNAAHRLKGLFSQFGALVAARHAAELEQAPGGLQAKAAQRLIELGPATIAKVRTATRKMLVAEVQFDITRMEAGQLRLDPAPANVREIVRSVSAAWQPLAAENGVALDCTVAPDVPPHVLVDGARLRQMLVNLVANAVKFTDSGRIDIGVTRAGSGDGAVVVRFEVVDSGLGIAPGDRERLFREYDQVTDHGRGGTGLGLAIVRRLADLMGGIVGVESAPGEGSRFFFELPLAPSAAPLHATPRQALALDGLDVLVAEDNATNRLIVSEILKDLGCRVRVAENGADAVVMAEQAVPDIVLMDIAMPVMDGHKALRRLRAGSGALSVIALTAYTMTDEVAGFLAEGFDAVLPKPVVREALAETLLRLARR